MNSIISFRDENRFLSNFYNAPVLWGDEITPEQLWDNNEIPYQLSKTANKRERDWAIRQINGVDLYKKAGLSKKIGGDRRLITMRPEFEADDGFYKRKVMEDLVRDKFQRNSNLKALLLATQDGHLEEGNKHGDRYWGTVDGHGRNELGKILMKVRAELI